VEEKTAPETDRVCTWAPEYFQIVMLSAFRGFKAHVKRRISVALGFDGESTRR
jgi:hypothetical protein